MHRSDDGFVSFVIHLAVGPSLRDSVTMASSFASAPCRRPLRQPLSPRRHVPKLASVASSYPPAHRASWPPRRRRRWLPSRCVSHEPPSCVPATLLVGLHAKQGVDVCGRPPWLRAKVLSHHGARPACCQRRREEAQWELLVYDQKVIANIDDRALAHLQVVVIDKLRRQESFSISLQERQDHQRVGVAAFRVGLRLCRQPPADTEPPMDRGLGGDRQLCRWPVHDP